MITRLSGTLIEKQPPYLLIDVNGIGYEVQVSMNTFYRLPEPNQAITLYTHLSIREDAHVLYGFSETQERALFRTLLKVSGIGPKIALAILSSIEPDGFVRCVEEQNIAGLQRLPGIGKKTAERLVIEMRDRLANWEWNDATMASLLTTNQSPANNKAHEQDAISALVALGYKPQEASRTILQVAQEGMSSQDLIRLALKKMTS
jgi:Holliday junction DNA helicase RuvA